MYNQACFNMCENNNCLVAPTKVVFTHVMTPMPQPVLCPIEHRRINHLMTYPVFIPHFHHTHMNEFN